MGVKGTKHGSIVGLPGYHYENGSYEYQGIPRKGRHAVNPETGDVLPLRQAQKQVRGNVAYEKSHPVKERKRYKPRVKEYNQREARVTEYWGRELDVLQQIAVDKHPHDLCILGCEGKLTHRTDSDKPKGRRVFRYLTAYYFGDDMQSVKVNKEIGRAMGNFFTDDAGELTIERYVLRVKYRFTQAQYEAHQKTLKANEKARKLALPKQPRKTRSDKGVQRKYKQKPLPGF